MGNDVAFGKCFVFVYVVRKSDKLLNACADTLMSVEKYAYPLISET